MHIVVLFVCDSLFKMVPKCSVELLPSVPKCEKAVICLTEKINVCVK